MKRIAFMAIWAVLGTNIPVMAEGSIPDKLLDQFRSTDWPTVLMAKESIENMEAAAIPQLMNMLDDFSMKKLKNTGDLIYPGTRKFYGHGMILDYNIDEICIRVGWLLEDLAFQNFGFSGIYIPEKELTDFIRYNFKDYYEGLPNKQNLVNMSAAEKRKIIRSLSIKKAQEWWSRNSASWNRLDALVESLQSADEKCQAKALFYIRNGKTQCTGLTKAFYQERLEAIIKELAKNDLKRISENAKLILLDMDYEWLKQKSVQKG
jgi:hypothetical protein